MIKNKKGAWMKKAQERGKIMTTGVPKLERVHVVKEYPAELNTWLLPREKNHLDVEYVGQGSYGLVVRYRDFAIKTFDAESYEEDKDPWNIEDESVYDYIPLMDLQGLPSVPVLYAYQEHEWMIVEFIKGISVNEMIDKGIWTKEWQQLLESQLRAYTLSCIKRGWVPRDLKSTHVFWCEDIFRWIDYGKYMKVKTFQEWIESDKVEDIVEEVKEELFSEIKSCLDKKEILSHIA
jgi:hypothetical protein